MYSINDGWDNNQAMHMEREKMLVKQYRNKKTKESKFKFTLWCIAAFVVASLLFLLLFVGS